MAASPARHAHCLGGRPHGVIRSAAPAASLKGAEDDQGDHCRDAMGAPPRALAEAKGRPHGEAGEEALGEE